jgi:hypothetical protein
MAFFISIRACFKQKIALYYVAFVGFQHFLVILGKIGGQETFFTGTVSYSCSLYPKKKERFFVLFLTDLTEMKRLHCSFLLEQFHILFFIS